MQATYCEVRDVEELMNTQWADKHDIKQLANWAFPMVPLAGREHVTLEQLSTLFERWKRNDCGMGWRDFTNSVSGPHSLLDNALIVDWAGMVLVVETDGYAHT